MYRFCFFHTFRSAERQSLQSFHRHESSHSAAIFTFVFCLCHILIIHSLTFSEAMDRWWTQSSCDQQLFSPNNTKKLIPLVAGVTTFWSVSAASCAIQMSCLGLSTGSIPPVPYMMGLVTVATASLASHWVATQMQQKQHQQFHWHDLLSRTNRNPLDSILSQNSISSLLTSKNMCICLVGIVSFRLLGGRFWAIAPSSYTNLGSFARFSLPATENYATITQKSNLQRLGRIWGCHTCGSRWRTMYFVGDHMPPKSVAMEKIKQRGIWRILLPTKRTSFRFYPQCTICSNKQGGMLARAIHKHKAGGGSNSYFHGWRPRLFHWTGGVVAMATTNPNNFSFDRNTDIVRDLERWSQQQLHTLQHKLSQRWTKGYSVCVCVRIHCQYILTQRVFKVEKVKQQISKSRPLKDVSLWRHFYITTSRVKYVHRFPPFLCVTKWHSALQPFSWKFTGVDKVSLFGSLFWDGIVFPARCFW